MFKQAFGSPRNQSPEPQEQLSILSPRNFIKMITSSIGQFKNNLGVPTQNNYQQFVATFAPYLDSFEQEMKKYSKTRNKRESTNSKHEQLQLELRINKIPPAYFADPDKFNLELFKRAQSKKKQEELSQYLDEIQLVLFTKAGKYPQKSNIILQNMVMLQGQTDSSLQKVLTFRAQLKQKLLNNSLRQLKVKKMQEKIQKINRTIAYIGIIKKIKDLKDISSSALSKAEVRNEEVLLKIKKSQIDQCVKFRSLKVIVTNLEKYRQSVKQKLYKQFLAHIQSAINQLLQYNKEQWKSINVPSSIFVGQTETNDISHNNITVLDQSYFAFESKNVNIINKKRNSLNTNPIQEEGQEENSEVIDMSKIIKLWALIKQFDLYDEIEVNEQFIKLLMKHNIKFNQDMQQYITFLYQSQMQEKQAPTSILKGAQTYASLKNRQKEESKIATEATTTNQTNIELSCEKISFMDMKLFLKITNFYFGLLKKVLGFINSSKELQFLPNFKHKFAQFLQGNISYFTNLKKITHDLSVDDFFTYLQIINYWENEDFDEISQFCETLKATKIQEYLTNIQKNLLIKQLKQIIEQSTYLPTPVSSDHYMTFHSILSPKNQPHFENQDINMSMTLQLEQNRFQDSQVAPREEVILRLINNYVVYKGRVYKICDSFLELAKNIQNYVKIKETLPETQQNIEEKICEIIGFYAWYNQKQITNTKNGNKSLKNYCTFYSTLLLLKCVIETLEITNKKLQKTRIQLNQCQVQLSKSITMTPFMLIEQKISQLYESKISTRVQAPTGESVKILQILKTSVDCLKQFFPIQYEHKLHQSFIYKFMQNTVKIIYKNYFGYLVNMQKRGLAEVKWFLPKIKEILEITTINSSALVNKKGQLLCKNGSLSFFLFNQQLQQMQRIMRQKTGIKS